MLKERLISALILAGTISLLILFLRDEYLIFFLAFISCLSFWEFIKVRFTNIISLLCLFIFALLLVISHLTFFNYLFIVLSVILYLTSTLFILSFPLNKNLLQHSLTWSLTGFITHLGFFAAIQQIISSEDLSYLSLNIENERFLILYIILISILMDSLAYFAGKSLGKRPFITNVSPNKTMEGFLIAILAAPLFLIAVSENIFEFSTFLVFLVLFLVSIFSVIGDAFASMMKRVIGVKDFSNLIPGHGGLFDRLDSHIAAFPCFIFLLKFL